MDEKASDTQTDDGRKLGGKKFNRQRKEGTIKRQKRLKKGGDRCCWVDESQLANMGGTGKEERKPRAGKKDRRKEKKK